MKTFLLLGAALVLAVSAAAQPVTPVMLSSERPCTVSVDGVEVAIISADSVKKVMLTRGEHLVSAVSIDKATWKQVVTVGAEQKVVQIQFEPATSSHQSSTASSPAAVQAAVVKGIVGILDIDLQQGGCVVAALLKDSPADRAGIRIRTILLSFGGMNKKEAFTDFLDAFVRDVQGQDVGSSVDVEFLNAQGRRSIEKLQRATIPSVGQIQVLEVGGRISTVDYSPGDVTWEQGWARIVKARTERNDAASSALRLDPPTAVRDTTYDCPFGYHFDFLKFHCVVN